MPCHARGIPGKNLPNPRIWGYPPIGLTSVSPPTETNGTAINQSGVDWTLSGYNLGCNVLTGPAA